MTLVRWLRECPCPVRQVLIPGVPVLIVSSVLASCNHEPKVTEVPYPYAEPGTIFFLEQADGANGDDAEHVGDLYLDDGCLRVGFDIAPPYRDPVIVWPEGFGLRVDGEIVQILNKDEKVEVSVGERVALGGSGTESRNDRIGKCSGPFWYAGWEVRTGSGVPPMFRDFELTPTPG